MAKEPKQFSINDLEEKILKFWETNHIFEKSLEQTRDKKPFTFYDGPPFATGLPHYGHILASTIKDLVPRYETMKGRYVRRRWGWDCHGLPIEEIVERKLGISGKKQIEKIGIKKFNETCRSTVLQYAEEWGKTVRRIARWIEFKNSYKTMDATYMESVWWAFKQIYDKKLIYEGRRVLLYCSRCETPISNFEVAMDNSYEDVEEETVTIKFKLKHGQKIARKDIPADTYFLAWTTTPWTLPGNVALAVGEDIEYVLVESGKEKFILAENLVSKIVPDGKIIEKIKGKNLVGLSYEPLFEVPAVQTDKAFKIYPADFVATDEGTGIVHTAVVYGEEDYQLGLKVGLPVVPLLDEKGVFNEFSPKLIRGMGFKESEKVIKEDLENRHLMFSKEKHTHSYPFCWRCGNMLFYNAIPAWFVNVQDIKPKLIKSNDKEINWYPEHLKHGRYEKSVEAAPDWNISRNRYWGNPIPVWKCDKCKHQVAMGNIEELDKHTTRGNTYTIVRHGEADHNLSGLWAAGPEDTKEHTPHLTPIGKDQMEQVGKSFKSKKVSVIYSSPYKRSLESAEIISKATGAKIIVDKRLHEREVGIYNWKPCDDFFRSFGRGMEPISNPSPKGGESLLDVRRRVMEFIRGIDAKYKGEHIVIVSHGDPLRMLEYGCSLKSIDFLLRPGDSQGFRFPNVSYNDDGQIDLHRPYIDEISFPCKKCNGTMRRTTEIFDSWLEAASMPFAEFHYPFENKKEFEERLPAQFVAEYIAQTRAWFYVMHVVSYVLFGKAPFENVVTTGTILAEDGSKMSKSKGNFTDPWIIIKKYGADSLRFYLMNSVVMQADNLNFADSGVQEAYRKVVMLLFNVYNYYATYIHQIGSEGSSGKDRLLDEWIKIKTEALVRDVTDYLNSYDTVRATRAIEEYVDGLSTWYLRRSRKRKDKAFFETLRAVLMTASKVIAPIMPFLSEEIYQKLRAQTDPLSVHLTEWPKTSGKLKVESRKLLEEMEGVRRLASVVLAKRAKDGIKIRQPLPWLTLRVGGSRESMYVLQDEVNVKEIRIDPGLEEEAVLNTTITPELREEGIVREFVRMVQGLRQDAGYKPGEPMTLYIEVKSAKPIIEKNQKSVMKDVGAHALEWKRTDKFDAELSTKFENEDVWLAVKK